MGLAASPFPTFVLNPLPLSSTVTIAEESGRQKPSSALSKKLFPSVAKSPN